MKSLMNASCGRARLAGLGGVALAAAAITLAFLPARLTPAEDAAQQNSESPQTSAEAAPAQSGSAETPPVKTAQTRTTDTLVAKTLYGDILLKDIFEYYALYLFPASAVPVRPVVRPDRFFEMDDLWLNGIAKSLAIAKANEAEIDASKNEALIQEYEGNLGLWALNYALPIVRQEFITDKTIDPTQDEINAYYEKSREEFFVPFHFHMRRIFVPALEPYTAAEGDTLESIAAKISGDPAWAGEIRSAAAGFPRRGVPEELKEKRVFKPLLKGEKLLVPMPADKRARVRQAMDKILEFHSKGYKFEELEAKYSQVANKGEVIGPLPSGVEGGPGVHPAIIEAGKSVPVGGVSPIIELPHGFTIIQVTERVDAHYKSVDEARQSILKTFRDKQSKNLERQLMDTMFSLPDLQVNYEPLEKTGSKTPPETVIAQVGSQRFTYKDIQPIYSRSIGDGATREQIFEGIKTHGGIFNALCLAWTLKSGAFDEPALKKRYDLLRTGVFGAYHVNKQIDQYVGGKMNEETVRDYFEKNKEKEFRQPPNFSYQVIERRPGPDYAELSEQRKAEALEALRVKLDQELAGIRSIHEFLDLALKTNPPPPPDAVPGVDPYRTLLTFEFQIKEKKTGEMVTATPEKTWSKAYIDGDRVRAVGVMQRREGAYRSYGEVRKDIADKLRKRASEEVMPKIEDAWLARSQYRFVLGQNLTPEPTPAEIPPPAEEKNLEKPGEASDAESGKPASGAEPAPGN